MTQPYMIERFERGGVAMVKFYDMLSDSYVEMTEEKYEALDKRPMIIPWGTEEDDS